MKPQLLLLSLLCCACFTLPVSAQPDTLWTRTFGGSSNDYGYSVQQTSEGGYIIAGQTPGYYSDAFYLIKTDALGIEQWSQTFDCGEEEHECCYSVQQTTDGGYILTGGFDLMGYIYGPAYLIKTDASGNEQWIQTFHSGWIGAVGRSVQQTSDGGYIIAGTIWYSVGFGGYLVKTDMLGAEEWSYIFGDIIPDYFYDVQQTDDGGYIIVGTYNEDIYTSESEVWLIKTDASGLEQWSQTFGGSDMEVGYSVDQTTDGGYIIGGWTLSYGAGNTDVYIIKTDASGNEQWSQTFGGSSGESCSNIQQTSDGGYIIAGTTHSYGAGNTDVYTIKIDASGDTLWTKTIGGTDSDLGYSVQQTSDGGYIITGYTWSYGAGGADVWLIKTEPDISAVKSNPSVTVLQFYLLYPYPNPFNPTTTLNFQLPHDASIELNVYDVIGNLVKTLSSGWHPPGSYQIPFDASDLSSGIYLARFVAGDFHQIQKLMLIK
jgi:hypothetical protein